MAAPILLILIAAISATASGQQDPRTTTHKGPVRIPLPCRGQDLSLRHVTDDAAMGGVRMIIYAFKNKSLGVCTLKGYPRFELLEKSGNVRPYGRAINSPASPGEEAKQPPQMVTLEPGKEAGFRVDYQTGGAGYLGKPCPVSRKVRITAPGTTRRFVVREEISLCSGLQLSPVRSEVPE
jgi:Protein of unknown function (DUF4232)